MKRVWKKAALVTCVIVLLTALAACALSGKQPAKSQQATASEAQIAATTTPYDYASWKQMYPLEYTSFAAGGDSTDDRATVPDREGYSHATMAKHMQEFAKKKDGKLGGVCIACKSDMYNELEQQQGNEVFSFTAETNEAMTTEQYWRCTTCHESIHDPAGTLGPRISATTTLGRTMFSKLDPGVAVCGQCHTTMDTWMEDIVKTTDDLKKYDPYRYGSDPASMFKAVREDGPEVKKVVDEATGAYIIPDSGVAELELFQGSTHQQMGLACADCHMPVETLTDGTTFTSHNASAGPSTSYASMSMCLDCHKTQGVENVGQMLEVLHGAQKEVAELDAQVVQGLSDLNAALAQAIAADKDEAILNSARDAYALASYYRVYVSGNNASFVRGAEPGETVAHNPQMSRTYLKTALSVIEDAKASLQ